MKHLFILIFGAALGWAGTSAYTNLQVGATSPREMLFGVEETSDDTVDPNLSADARAQQRVDELEEKLRASSAREAELKTSVEKAELMRKEAKEQLDKYEKEFEDYKQEYRLSMQYRAQGMKLAVFRSGLTEIENVEIVEVEGTAVRIRHDGGGGKYQIDTLEPELQRLLGFDVPM